MRLRALTFAAAALAALPTLALAADPVPSLDLRGFHASTDPESGIYLEPARSPATLDWNTALWMNYVYRPVVLRDPATNDVAFRVISHQLSGDLTANVGFAERVALGLDLPFLVYQTGDDPTDASRRVLGETAVPAQAIGDMGLVGKLTLVQPTAGDLGGFALALHERFTLPTGDDASFMGEGHVTSETRLLAEYRLVALSVHGALGVLFRGERESFACANIPLASDGSDPCETRFGNELPFGFGIAVRPQALGLDDAGRWTWLLETHGHLPLAPVAPFEDARLSEAQLGAGARYAIRDVSVLAGIETALAGGIGNPPLRVMASVGWAPRVHDADGDGIEDDTDQCRELAEDKDGFQDEDGCPEGDNDEDGVVDADDRCPTELEDEDGFMDEDGCPDLDNDKDGILDEQDACPLEVGIASPDPAKNGCADRDVDRDGVFGADDRCPDAVEDLDGFEDQDGCPDPDNDKDGISDVEDACPNEKGIPSWIKKENGCPDQDPDRDTIQGALDKCPNEAEVFNGIDDLDGCPDGDAKKKGKPLLKVTEKKDGPQVEMSAAVKLTDSAIDPESMALLHALAAELLAHPTWSVAVGVKPSPKGGQDEALRKAFVVVDTLRRLTKRDQVAETVGWAAVKDLPRAYGHGIGFLILTTPEAEVAP